MKSDTYVVIQGWMCNELNLSGNDLLVFALIHGFSQDGESKFTGSRRYIAETFNISLPTVDRSLKHLLDKNLIEQHKIEQNGIIFNHYNSLYPITKCYRGDNKMLPNKIENKIENKPDNNSKELLQVNTQEPEFEFGKRKKSKPTLYSQYISLIQAKTDDIQVRKLLVQWLQMLLEKYKDKQKPLYVNMFKGKLKMLDKFDVKDWPEIIEYNIQRGYEGFYPIRINNYTNTDVRQTIEQLPPSEVMTEDDYKELERITEERRKRGLRTEF